MGRFTPVDNKPGAYLNRWGFDEDEHRVRKNAAPGTAMDCDVDVYGSSGGAMYVVDPLYYQVASLDQFPRHAVSGFGLTRAAAEILQEPMTLFGCDEAAVGVWLAPFQIDQVELAVDLAAAATPCLRQDPPRVQDPYGRFSARQAPRERPLWESDDRYEPGDMRRLLVRQVMNGSACEPMPNPAKQCGLAFELYSGVAQLPPPLQPAHELSVCVLDV